MPRLIYIITIFLFTVEIQGQDFLPRTNMDILDSLASGTSAKIISFLESHSYKLALLENNAHPSAWLLSQKLTSLGAGAGIKFVAEDTTGTIPRLKLNITEILVRYENSLTSDDTLFRYINFNVSGNLYGGGEIIPLGKINSRYQDKISRREIPLVENTPYSFARGKVPDPPGSFFDEILEPAVILLSSAVAVFLLFTVRSQ